MWFHKSGFECENLFETHCISGDIWRQVLATLQIQTIKHCYINQGLVHICTENDNKTNQKVMCYPILASLHAQITLW